ncbi:hypothetical protein [Candidatus Desulforudis audaxviator]|uniref:hypothetical protein n=1 Tax=Candidatus Desulforudis audaxviator TaxID=471827 RepID=UPI00140F6D5C|nr:hypothetical protein [Candidatus Desulforudis audaxviator]
MRIPSEGTVLTGTLLMPAGEGPFPCVVIAGGTMSHTRDGRLIDPDRVVPERDALKRLATRLAAAGYASSYAGISAASAVLRRGRGLLRTGMRPLI